MIRWLALLLAVLATISLFIGDGTFALPDGLILWQLRVPRTLLGMLVGGGLVCPAPCCKVRCEIRWPIPDCLASPERPAWER